MSHVILGFSMLLFQIQPLPAPPTPTICPNIDPGAFRILVATPLPLKGSVFIGRKWNGPKLNMWLGFNGQKPRRMYCNLDCSDYCTNYVSDNCNRYCQPNDIPCLQYCNYLVAQCFCDYQCCDDLTCPP